MFSKMLKDKGIDLYVTFGHSNTTQKRKMMYLLVHSRSLNRLTISLGAGNQKHYDDAI